MRKFINKLTPVEVNECDVCKSHSPNILTPPEWLHIQNERNKTDGGWSKGCAQFLMCDKCADRLIEDVEYNRPEVANILRALLRR